MDTENREEFWTNLRIDTSALMGDEDAWTWIDQDPDVAWDDDSSGHGKLAALYLEAGWERCYHRDARFHFDVKLKGNASYRALHDALDASGLDHDGLMEHVNWVHDGEMESWWENVTYAAVEDRETGDSDHRAPLRGVYQCGRSGGYLNASRYEKDTDTMLDIARYCAESVEYFTSADYGEWLAETAIEAYNDEKMDELASPRIERIEA